MKNKALITYCTNILVGLLFSFPVFSSESIASFSSAQITTISCNELCINKIADTKNKHKKEFPGSFQSDRSSDQTKTSDNEVVINFHQSPVIEYDHDLFSGLEASYKLYLEFTFVNLSYYNELEITKMLC